MKTVVGVFPYRASAECAVIDLMRAGFPQDRITLLTSGDRVTTEAMPTTDGEAPGVGPAIGAAVGAAVGGAAGLPIGVALASFVVPGIGPVIAAGVLGAAALAAAGAAVGSKLEDTLIEGVPKDEALIYMDAVRRGRSVVVALADDDTAEETARATLRAAGAESLDAARDLWWEDVRASERARYAAAGRSFDADEPIYRRGFECALRLGNTVDDYGDAQEHLREMEPDAYDKEPFRAGFESGQAWLRAPGDPRDRDRRAA